MQQLSGAQSAQKVESHVETMIVDNDALFQNRQVNIRMGADVYNHLKSYKKSYRKAPDDGLDFEINYIDTKLALKEELRASAPIVLLLHGAPGSYEDYKLLIRHLSRENVRVISPNFPDYSATIRTKILYRHSADEKAAYLRDFLLAIQVTKIDLLISHSSAIFPSLLLLLNSSSNDNEDQLEKAKLKNNNNVQQNDVICKDMEDVSVDGKKPEATRRKSGGNSYSFKNRRKSRDQPAIVKFEEESQKFEIKSLALFNPAGHRLPKSMKPAWFKCGAVHFYQQEVTRYIFRKCGPAFLSVVGVPVKVDDMDNVMLSATVMRNSKCGRVKAQLEKLSQKKVPTLLIFSENDKLIDKEIFYEMAQFMSLEPQTFDAFDANGEIESNPIRRTEGKSEPRPAASSSASDWIRVMVFKEGGHYAYSNYAKIVNKAVSQFLAKTSNTKTS